MGCILPCRGHEVALGDNQKVTRQKKRRYNEINHVTSVSSYTPGYTHVSCAVQCAALPFCVRLMYCSARLYSS